MIIATVISVILAIIGLLLVVDYGVNDRDKIILKIGALLFMVCMSLTIIFVMILNKQQTETTKEYPASEYTLGYKITELEEQRDTTYVIIPKKDKK